MGSFAPPTVAKFPEAGLHLMAQDVLPRAYLARRRCVADDAAAWNRLHAPDYPVGREAVEVCADGDALEPRGTVRASLWEPDLVDLEVNSTGGELVINDAWHRGWTATLDGAPVPVARANLVVRGVHLTPGAHRVQMRFRTPGLLWGGLVSLLTLAGLLGAACISRSTARRRMDGPAPDVAVGPR